MIKLTSQGTQIFIETPYNPRLNSIFRAWHLRWQPNVGSKGGKWVAPAFRYGDLKSKLEEFDSIDDQVNIEALNSLEEKAVKKSQFSESTRRVPDYSIMNYPPMKGKAPNEDFQHKGITMGINKSCYLYAWDMGSGKSYIASAIIAHRMLKYGDCNKVLFVTTTIGVRNLYFELLKFIKGLDESRIAIADKDNRLPFTKDVDIVITNYNSFRLICNEYKKQKKITAKNPRRPYLPISEWVNGGNAMLILDESHSCANATSQQTKMMLLHAPLFKYRYLFSGTVADKPEKLYPQYQILDPWLNYGLNFTDWKNKLAVVGNRFSASAIEEWKMEELEKLNKRFLDGYGNHYKTEDLLDLPDYYEKPVYIKMSPKHREIYQAFINEDLNSLNGLSVRDVVNRFPYMLLSVDYPPLLDKHEEKFSPGLNKLIAKFDENYIEKYSYIDKILEEEHPNDKGIIWCIHPRTIETLGKRYAKYNPICIDGSIEQNVRFEMVEEFKKGDHKLLIANISCLNTSVTILEATFQIYCERGFNYTQYEQSTRRIFRAGQTRNVDSYVLIYDRSIDTLLDKNLKSKGSLVDGLVSKKFLTADEWRNIFNCSPNDNIEGY